jgi:uncharacterized protein
MAGDAGSVHHAAARLELYLPGVDSLKGKRALLRRTEARLRDELGCAVAEVGLQDLWQRAILGVSTVSGTASGVERVLDRLAAVVERDPRVEVLTIVETSDRLDADVSDLPLHERPTET